MEREACRNNTRLHKQQGTCLILSWAVCLSNNYLYPPQIKALYPLIEDVCAKLVKYTKKMSEENEKDGLDTRELAAKYTIDVVSTCIFAMDGGSFTKKDSEIRKVANRVMLKPDFTLVIKFIVSTMLPSLKKLIKLNFIPKEVEIFFTDLLNQALRYRKDNNITRVDYLDYLTQLKDKKNLTELDLAAHTITFFVDGFDTSSVFISHALFLVRNTYILINKMFVI